MSLNLRALASVLSLAVPELTAGAPPPVPGALGTAEAIVSAVIQGVTLAEQVYDGLKGNEKAQLVLADAKQLAESLGVNVNALWGKMQRPLQVVINFVVMINNLKGLWPPRAASPPAAAPQSPVAA